MEGLENVLIKGASSSEERPSFLAANQLVLYVLLQPSSLLWCQKSAPLEIFLNWLLGYRKNIGLARTLISGDATPDLAAGVAAGIVDQALRFTACGEVGASQPALSGRRQRRRKEMHFTVLMYGPHWLSNDSYQGAFPDQEEARNSRAWWRRLSSAIASVAAAVARTDCLILQTYGFIKGRQPGEQSAHLSSDWRRLTRSWNRENIHLLLDDVLSRLDGVAECALRLRYDQAIFSNLLSATIHSINAR